MDTNEQYGTNNVRMDTNEQYGTNYVRMDTNEQYGTNYDETQICFIRKAKIGNLYFSFAKHTIK